MGDSGGTTQRPVLDADLFPHIIDRIIAHAPYPSLLAFRTTSKTFRKRIDALILENILIWPMGRTSSRRGPHYRLPWVNFADEIWRVECVRIMDVHPHGMLSGYTCYEDAGKLTEGYCNWYNKVVHDKLAGVIIPVLRRWGRQDRDSIRARLGIAFLDPPLDGFLVPNNMCMAGCETRVYQVPLSPGLTLLTYGTNLWPDRNSNKIVIRRRTSASKFDDWVPSAVEDEELGADLARLLDGVQISRTAIRHHPDEIVFVDYDGEDYVHADKGDDGTWSTTGSKWPLSRGELMDAAWEVMQFGWEEMLEDNLSFVTMDEYRRSIGEGAFLLEEDDHRFAFTEDGHHHREDEEDEDDKSSDHGHDYGMDDMGDQCVTT